MTVFIIAFFLLLFLTVLLNRARFFLYVNENRLAWKIKYLFFTFSVHQIPEKRQNSEKRAKPKKHIRPSTVKLAVRTFCNLLPRIRTERLKARITVASREPDKTAERYGAMCVWIPKIVSLLDAIPQNGKIDVRISPDFTRTEQKIYVFSVLSLRPIDILLAILHLPD